MIVLRAVKLVAETKVSCFIQQACRLQIKTATLLALSTNVFCQPLLLLHNFCRLTDERLGNPLPELSVTDHVSFVALFTRQTVISFCRRAKVFRQDTFISHSLNVR